ncbi:platelet glycoprotein Ib alpha chain-like [Melanotaenia boesemani]|uniref:platelet glycoprotein Ib alpha chain-like n=1 Tax=Melanotaenia boesemani TaxID=1250792 RepID=UPI001C05C709|nr:platelet glycoprotein Ib alpha chain-like [Melanotaenia boesemani]
MTKPEPSSHPDKPEPSSHPATPEPSSHPATPEPSSHPATPEPSSHPATPEPSSHPDKPEPSSRPATPVSIVTPTSSGPNPSGSGFLNCTLDPSVVKNVKDAWEGENSGVLVSKIGPYKLFFGDIFNTAPQRELESEIDPVLYKYVLGIVNESHHWMLVVMLPGEKRSLFLDPLGESTSKINHCKDISR